MRPALNFSLMSKAGLPQDSAVINPSPREPFVREETDLVSGHPEELRQ